MVMKRRLGAGSALAAHGLRYRLDDSGSNLRQGQGILFALKLQTGSRTTQAIIQWVTGVIFTENIGCCVPLTN